MHSNDETQIMERLEKKMHYQMNNTWLNILDNRVKNNFLSNFNSDNLTGLALLDMLLLHNHKQEIQLLKTLLYKMYSHIYKSNYPKQEHDSGTIEMMIQEEMRSAAFIPVTDKNPADSAYAWTQILRSLTETSNCYYEIESLPLLLSTHIKYVVFFDDMLGTGTQFDTFLNMGRFDLNQKKSLSISDLLNANPSIICYYLCMAGHVDGISAIETEHPSIHIIVSEKFDNDDNVLSPNNEYWADYPDVIRDRVIDNLQKTLSEKDIKESFTKNITVIFERSRPSNTVFPLYWSKKNGWNPIIAREGEA